MANGFDPSSINVDSMANVSVNDPAVKELVERLSKKNRFAPIKGNPTCNGGCTNTTDCSATQNVGCTNTWVCYAESKKSHS